MSNATNTNTLARIENHFIFNASLSLSAREQKIILYLIAQINPIDRKFEEQVVSIKEIHNILMEKRSGSFYEQIDKFVERFADELSNKRIIFDSTVKFRGKKMKGFINWFQSIIPTYNDAGDACLKFKFSTDLKPFLLELKQYTQVDYKQVMPLGSGFAVRMYQVFRACRDKMQKHQILR